jgi:hypothetical protein
VTVGAGLIVAASCAFLRGGGERHLAFSHGFHVGELELDCFNCHADAFALDHPGMPAPDTCAACHDELDEEKAPERVVSSLFVDEVFAARRAGALEEEVIFSHLRHVESGLECSACHATVERAGAVSAGMGVAMADCTSCHEARGQPAQCTTCHTSIDRGWAPENHHFAWLKNHGSRARAGAMSPATDCSLCHQTSSCSSCHLEQEPESHDTFFRRRGHAVMARIDREQCAVCHQPDSCDRCHSTTRPTSHAGSWSSARNTHCLACHFPQQAEGCVLCHGAGAGHVTGAAKPADHHPAMNCRMCHGLSAPLPHVEKGDDCNACHP